MTRLVVLDNEAVQALARPHHPKHRRVLGYVELVERRKRRAMAISILAPTAVRVEAGWDRSSSQWAFINRLRIVDVVLDAACANKAAAILEQARVSVADAHIGATVQSAPDADITVVTSDPGDIRRVAGGRPVTVVAI
jgi:predicted nucleic acid-binding protein